MSFSNSKFDSNLRESSLISNRKNTLQKYFRITPVLFVSFVDNSVVRDKTNLAGEFFPVPEIRLN